MDKSAADAYEEQFDRAVHLLGVEGTLLASSGRPRGEVVTLAGRRDRVAFTALVRQYQPDLLRVCYVILGDAALAEDAAQSAWIRAWSKLDQLRDERKVRPWLIAVAANEARQIARRRRAPRASMDHHFGADADPRLADLAEALALLTPDERHLISLRYVAELTSEQIGAAVGLTAGAVRHRLSRLLARLRQELGG